MECNKEEAIRAKEIAEKKMRSNDFEGARRIALKAKNLYPELDNMTHMLSICDVYCSAEIKLPGLDKDWYSVLQVEKLANESTIKKQYRKLALVLHPDKNRFPGAEGAFKLICEANAVLSDPAKKTVYDNKIKVLAKPAAANPPNHQANRKYQQYGAQNNTAYNGFSSQNTQSSSYFWTRCPYCKCIIQCSRELVGRCLQCSQCLKPYAACETSAPHDPSSANMGYQGVPSKPSTHQPDVFQERVGTNQASFGIGVKNVKVPSTSHAGSQGTANMKSVKPQPAQKGGGSESINVASAAENLKTKETVLNANPSRGKKARVTSNGDAVRGGSRNTRAKSQNRGRKVVLESSDDDTNIEDMTEQENLDAAAATDLKSEFACKSSRRRQHVSYKEPDEDDCARSVKRAHTTKEANGKEHEDAVDGEDSKRSFPTVQGSSKSGNKEMGAAHSKESVKDKNEDKEGEFRGVTSGRSSAPADDTFEVETDSDLDFSLSENSESGLHECPDPEFSNFDKLREESQFHPNQFWACYDTTSDSMPRYYAKVRKVRSSPFELSITWLEAVPIDESWERWVDEELPVGCGSFKLGQTDKVSGCLSLSHQVHCEKGKKRGSLFIYPRKGEVWALYRDWDISWSSNPNPENHKKFQYEVVEVLSDFAAGVGIQVGYLDKVSGFVSLFRRAMASPFLIEPTKVYKFSHCIPSFKMTGSEKGGVPIGALELDPASLPSDPNDLFFPCKAEI